MKILCIRTGCYEGIKFLLLSHYTVMPVRGKILNCLKAEYPKIFKNDIISTGKNVGQVRGPIQFTFARSIDPIAVAEHSITRMAVATEKEAEKQDGGNRTMGRKATIPYGLYVCHGFISANLAQQTGFSEEDLELFWNALKNMFDVDRSAARGLMSAQKLIVFKHDSILGNAPANKLFELVKVEKVCDGAPRSFIDYSVTIDKENAPSNVTIEELI